jgi:hypothetical protein
MAALYPPGGRYRAHSDNGLAWVDDSADAARPTVEAAAGSAAGAAAYGAEAERAEAVEGSGRGLRDPLAAPPRSPPRSAQRRNHRAFTAIVYANGPGWIPSDGGHLRVFLGSAGGPDSPCGHALAEGAVPKTLF